MLYKIYLICMNLSVKLMAIIMFFMEYETYLNLKFVGYFRLFLSSSVLSLSLSIYLFTTLIFLVLKWVT